MSQKSQNIEITKENRTFLTKIFLWKIEKKSLRSNKKHGFLEAH